jgi:hypothetical protein
MTKIPLVVAVTCLYSAHLLMEPVKVLSNASGTVLENFGRLLNETTTFSFEILRDTKTEFGLVYRGVALTHMVSASGSWCVHEVALVPDNVVSSFQEAYENAPPQVLGLFRASVSELSRGTQRVRHLVKDLATGPESSGQAAMILGRRVNELGSLCVAFQTIKVNVEWANMLPRILSAAPNPLEHHSGVSALVRTSLLNALAADFPEEVAVQNLQLTP